MDPLVRLFLKPSDSIGTFENQDVYSFFDLPKPLISTLNDANSSTEAIPDANSDERDKLNDAGIFEPNIIVDSLDNEVPDEYKNDPDLWYAIQQSLKVFPF